MSDNPEIGQFEQTGSYRTNVHVAGNGPAMLVLHGSGAGVCAWANWRTFIPAMQDRFQVIAPDLVGFGYTETPADFTFRFMDSWVEQIIALMDGLGIQKAHVVGNSFGGSLALWLAARPGLPASSPLATASDRPLALRGVVSMGGIADLAEFAGRSRSGCSVGAVRLLGGEPADAAADDAAAAGAAAAGRVAAAATGRAAAAPAPLPCPPPAGLPPLSFFFVAEGG
jgi:pimeloyl-ACP methyl ester carboxylesterase